MTILDSHEPFPTSLRGYDRQSVDAFVATAGRRLDEAETVIGRLQEALDVSVGERERLMRTAEQARREANDVTAAALAEAAERLAVAAADANCLIEAADLSAEEIISEARRVASLAHADERSRLDDEADLLTALRVAVAAERFALDEHRRSVDAELDDLASRVLSLRTSGPTSTLPSAMDILRDEIPDSGPPDLADGAQPFLLLPASSLLPPEPVPANLESPPATPAPTEAPIDDVDGADLSDAHGYAATIEADPEVGTDVMTAAADDEAVTPAPADETCLSLDDLELDLFGPEPPAGPWPEEGVARVTDIERADPGAGSRGLNELAELADDEAFDAYFADDADPEPSRAWMLG